MNQTEYQAFNLLLERVKNKNCQELREKQTQKLIKLYGSPITMKQQQDSYVNLSDEKIDPDIEEIFNQGMNCHLKTKFDKTKRKVEVELFYENVREKIRNKKGTLEDEESFKCELERFGTKQVSDHTPHLLTKDQLSKVKEFNANSNIVTRKADKSNVYVVMNKVDYDNKLDEIVADDSKFKKIDSDPTDDLKRELNKLILEANKSGDAVKFQKREGQYDPGYIYGNPKIHKKLQDPPLRPIISQVGTVTYDIAKQLNSLIVKYLPNQYSIKSTYEFLKLLENCDSKNKIGSLDVTNLFTNVPVMETIEIILKNVYNNGNIPAPNIPQETLRQLLIISTTKTPFRHINGDLYIQIEGVSMGSCLGPTFANFYMCNLENKVFQENPSLKPALYTRYVDDIFVAVENAELLELIKNEFESKSVLQFTYENEKCEKLTFLDCIVTRMNEKFHTGVYVKDTNNGDCINFKSVCPERYKIGVIKTLLHRGYHISADWATFHLEIERIKQLLSNNNFPMEIIETTIKKFLNSLTKPKSQIESEDQINFYFQNQMTSNYKAEEEKLRKIVHKHISSVSPDSRINLQIYYKTKKTKNLFIKNNMHKDIDSNKRHHVVYQYTCSRAECNFSKYIGYTTCSLHERFKMHTQNGSIIKHLRTAHKIQKVPRKDLLENTSVLATVMDRRKLIMTEAVFIKEKKPNLNSQAEGCDRLIKIFVH